MLSPTPLWKRIFDLADQRLSPKLNELAQSDDIVTLAALSQRGRHELQRRLEHMSRRAWHLLNLPAGSDVNRLLEHIARLEREVGDLRHKLDDRENAEYLASLSARHLADTRRGPRKPAPLRSSPREAG